MDQTSHTYDEETADEIFNKIINDYLDAFVSFKEKMEEIKNEESSKRFEWWKSLDWSNVT